MERVHASGAVLASVILLAGCGKDINEQLRRLTVKPDTATVGIDTAFRVTDPKGEKLPACMVDPGTVYLRAGGKVYSIPFSARPAFADQDKSVTFMFRPGSEHQGDTELYWCYDREPEPGQAGHSRLTVLQPSVSMRTAPPATGEAVRETSTQTTMVVTDPNLQKLIDQIREDLERLRRLQAKIIDSSSSGRYDQALQDHKRHLQSLDQLFALLQSDVKAANARVADVYSTIAGVSLRVDQVESNAETKLASARQTLEQRHEASEAKTERLDRNLRSIASAAAEGLQGRINFGRTTVRHFPYLTKEQRESEEIIQSLEESLKRMEAIARGEDISTDPPVLRSRVQ
jgi:hypothetical protein